MLTTMNAEPGLGVDEIVERIELAVVAEDTHANPLAVLALADPDDRSGRCVGVGLGLRVGVRVVLVRRRLFGRVDRY